MPEDRTPNADELSATTPKTGPGTVDAEESERPPAEPRSTERLTDDDPSLTAANEDDETQAS